ncbi:MAG: TatD family hydrolase [Lachnospiraceae bacterium]|nr:TatD family hydrolase [Lachnospiraceae bacterium]
MIFDTHAHYDDPRYDGDRDEVLNNLATHGVGRVVDICAAFRDLEKILSLAERYPFVYAAVGVHPSEVGGLNDEKIDCIRQAAAHPKVVAIGEIGLDYHYDDGPSRDVQKTWFLKQLDVAKETGLPVVIHSRDASKDTLDIMRKAHENGITGVIHCFSGSVETAEEYLKMGYFLGIGGVLTFKNSKTLRGVVRIAPIEQLVLETDCPYLAPEPHRGERNDSRLLPSVVSALAQIKGMDEAEVIAVTEKNACALYRLKEPATTPAGGRHV